MDDLAKHGVRFNDVADEVLREKRFANYSKTFWRPVEFARHRNDPLVVKKLCELSVNGFDLRDVAYIGWRSAAEKYSGRPEGFKPYAAVCVRNEITDFLRTWNKRGITQLPRNSEPPLVYLPDNGERLPEPTRQDQLATWDAIQHVIRSLSDEDRLILTRFYLRGWSADQIAREMNISPQHARRLKSQALARANEVGGTKSLKNAKVHAH